MMTKRDRDLDLMRLHVEALFTHDTQGDLVRVNEPRGKPAPRFFLGLTTAGRIGRFRYDVETDVRRALQSLSESEVWDVSATGPPTRLARYDAVLARLAPVQRTWAGPAFCFPKALPTASDAVLVTAENAHALHPFLDAWIPDVRFAQPMYAAIIDGAAVAVCASVRQTAEAHEAGVETAAPFRGQGHAARVVNAWASAVRRSGRVPIYSTSWDNEGSRAVARRLALQCFGTDFHIA